MKPVRLTGKIMEEKLKIGWTEEDFANHFQIPSESFSELVRKTFSQRACKDYFNRLYKNRKLKEKHMKNAKKRKKIPSNQKKEENVVSLEFLKKEEERQQKYLCMLEGKHQELVSRRMNAMSILKNKKADLLKLKKAVSKHQKEIEKVIQEVNDISKQMNKKLEEIHASEENLENIKKSIKKQQVIEIFVYEDGSIEAEGVVFEENSENWKAAFNDMIEDEKMGNLKINQIKQLAKLREYTRSLEAEEIKYNITFESEESEKVFQEIA